jgi:hypothetical protein
VINERQRLPQERREKAEELLRQAQKKKSREEDEKQWFSDSSRDFATETQRAQRRCEEPLVNSLCTP